MTFKQKLLAAFGQALDSVPEPGEEETVDTLKAKLAKLQSEKADAEKAATDAKQKATDAEAKVTQLTADVATVTAERDALKKAAPTEPQKVTHDAATVSLAEVLAPGIAKNTADLKAQALKKAYATADGKAAIDEVTGGGEPAYDAEPLVNATFRAAAAILAAKRKAALNPPPTGGTNDGKTLSFADAFNKRAAELHKTR